MDLILRRKRMAMIESVIATAPLLAVMASLVLFARLVRERARSMAPVREVLLVQYGRRQRSATKKARNFTESWSRSLRADRF